MPAQGSLVAATALQVAPGASPQMEDPCSLGAPDAIAYLNTPSVQVP